MSRARQPFQQRDVTRLLKAARAAGEGVACVEIEPGKIVLILDDHPQAATTTDTTNEWDGVK
jgi:hypothetical protein